MDASEEVEVNTETRRTTRSGRTIKSIPEVKKSPGRKTRKKVVMIEVEVSDEDMEKDGSKEKKEEDEIMETENVDLDASDNAVEAPEIENNKNNEVINEEMEVHEEPVLNQIVFDDSNSMINDFNSFKGAESSSDAINNESNSCFDVIQESTENAQDIPLQNENSEMNDNKEVSDLPEDLPALPEENNVDSSDSNEAAKNKTNNLLPSVDPDAENISEDELPTVQVVKVPETEEVSDEELPKQNDGEKVTAVKVPETEEVSDEELPGPRRAELPADTEVVSEDELETVKKENNKRKLDEDGYDPGSPTSENETAPKKPALEISEEVVDVKEKPKKLPELDKYWKAVNDDPTDFTGWTYLLQYVDQENDMEAAREAYDAFLSHYPYCYGYWRKYADYEKRKGNKKKCEEVFERGLKAIPLSVDLWIHYLTYIRTTKADDEEFVRSQFERSLDSCGLEFRSDRLWENYIKWETEGKRLLNATHIYERLLATPTQGYLQHFDNFQEHIQTNPPNKVLEVGEFLALRKDVKALLKQEVADLADNPDIPPGADSEENTDEETKAIKERIISIRRKVHKNTSNLVTERWNFEEGIKRPYFHVKPLERCQLKNWQDYLEFEITQGDKTRIIVLFERCLVACALYEDFWLKYVHYLQGLEDESLIPKIKDVYERACTIHHLKKPNIHLQWAMFEESIKNYNKSAEILQNLEKSVPNLLQIAYRRINLERRRGDHEKCCQLFEHYITNTKNKVISTNLAIKYSRFTLQLLNSVDKALEIINTAIIKDPNNSRLYLQLIDVTLRRDKLNEDEIIKHINAFLDRDGADIDQKVLFAQRKLEFLEDFGCEIISVQRAYNEYQKYLKASKESGKKKDSKQDSAKKDKSQTTASSNSYNNYGGYGNSTAGSYQYGNSQQGTYNQYPQYGQGGEQYQYGNWPYQGNYSGYNQWGGYGSGYSY